MDLAPAKLLRYYDGASAFLAGTLMRGFDSRAGLSMSEQQVVVRFDNADPSDASRMAQELSDCVAEIAPEATVKLINDNPNSQDFGATIVLLFGTPVAIALAKAVTVYLQRTLGASITISRDGEVVAKNLDSRDAARIAEAFGKPKS
jgi:hypothetical protein